MPNTWEVVDLLMRLHPGEEIGLDMAIGPAEVEVKVGDWLGLHEPLIFLGEMLDDGILGF